MTRGVANLRSMKKILILQMRPECQAADSELEAIVEKGHIPTEGFTRLRVEQLDKVDFDLDDYSAIIAGGSPFDLSTPQNEKSEMQLKVENFYQRLFKKIIPQDFPFLGACSGNGLLGQFAGTPISTQYGEPIGTVTIEVTKEGEADQLLNGVPSSFQALVGHKEACDSTPPGATLLASSAACPIQMFRMKNNIYATQFHPEADARQFEIRIDIYKDYGYFPADQAEVLKQQLVGVQTPAANEILRRFVVKYRRS